MPKSSAKLFVSSAAEADTMALQPYPNSRKTYTVGSRPDIRVPFREIDLSPTVIKEQTRINPPFSVYDTSGVYTDPDAHIDIRTGLPRLREGWIEERGDTDCLAAPHPNLDKHDRLILNLPLLDFLYHRHHTGLKNLHALRKCIMLAVALSPLKWNLLPFVKTSDFLLMTSLIKHIYYPKNIEITISCYIILKSCWVLEREKVSR